MVIDHINHNPSDNRLSNLRCVTQKENQRNMKLGIRNRTGVAGVSYQKGSWQAQLKIGERHIHLGCFDTKQEATAARRAAEIVAGFHPNHGTKRAAPFDAALTA